MIAKRNVMVGILGWLMLASPILAQEFYFLWTGEPDAAWDDASNWSKKFAAQGSTTVVLDGPLIPGTTDQVWVQSRELRITNHVAIGYLKCGIDAISTVTIDGGSLTATGTRQYNSACVKKASTLVIKNGGSATFSNYFMVGSRQIQGGAVKIYDGTLRVASIYFHNKDYNDTAELNTRTTLYEGGLLDVDELILNAGVLDIAGGRVVVRNRTKIPTVAEWIAQGRIIAMGGVDGWTVRIQEDPATGWFTLTAEPPLVVGFCNQAVSKSTEPGLTRPSLFAG